MIGGLRKRSRFFAVAMSMMVVFVLPQLVRSAWSNESLKQYDRVVQIDWEKIEGAKEYEFERFSGSDCAKSEGVQRVESAVWKARLSAGVYCVRIRGINEDGKAGQWSENQRVEVRPKPIVEVFRKGNTLSWEAIPYASQYEVKIIDLKGEAVYKKMAPEARLEIPVEVLKKPGFRIEDVRVSIRTHALGVPPSIEFTEALLGAAASTKALTAAEAARRIGGDNFEAGQGAIARLRVYSQQFPAQRTALTPKVDEAVRRYRLTGEKPVLPTEDEWNGAFTPEQKENLKRRQIASERIEHLERFDRTHPPDITLWGGVQGGEFQYSAALSGSDPVSSSRLGQTYRLGIDYNRNRAWGAFFSLSRQSIAAASDSAYTVFGLGLEYHLLLGEEGDKRITLGAGAGYLRLPLTLDFLNPADPSSRVRFAYPVGVLGAELKFKVEIPLSRRLEISGGVEYLAAPTQSNLSDVLPGVSASALRSALLLNYQLTRQVELGLGGFVTSAKAQATASGMLTEFRQSGVYLQGAYRIRPKEYRTPASLMQPPRFSMTAWVPAAFRAAVVRSNSGGALSDPRSPYPYDTSATVTGLDLDLGWHFAKEAGIAADVHIGAGQIKSQGQTFAERDIRGRVGYEIPFLGSRTTRVQAGGGGFYRTAFGATSSASAGFVTAGGLISGQLTRNWSSRWNSDVLVQAGVPAMVQGLAEPLKSDPGARTNGANYFWSAGFSTSWKIGGDLSLIGALNYEQLRLGLAGTGSLATSEMTLDYEEGRIRLGLQYRW